MPSTEIIQPFRPRARLLQLLGDELIGNPRLAVFELVKNAYDADANTVTVRIDLSAEDEATITVRDDGEGMTLDVLQSVWLVPGDDHRRKQREQHIRSPKHDRLPLGEKGLGRFAVHKLGNRIRLTTRAHGCEECIIDINWNNLIDQSFLDEAHVRVTTQSPDIFTDGTTGTQIEIQELRPPIWNRREIRKLYIQIMSICSPFSDPGDFRATLQVPGHEEWISKLPDFATILDRAIWKFDFELKDGTFNWTYEFREISGFNLESRKIIKENAPLQLPKSGRNDKDKIIADKIITKDIGPVRGQFYVFDRDREVLQQMDHIQPMTKYLDGNGGIRVYRDNIRVYNYGEQGDDWLGLDLRRVNVPTRRISNNIILGAIHLDLDSSSGLTEKTNREGFVENEAYHHLCSIVLGALATLEHERQIDKDRIRSLTKKPSDPVISRIEKPIQELREVLKDHDVAESFEPYVTRIERNYEDMQETLLTAGMSGLNLAVIFHEVERGVRTLHQVIADGQDLDGALKQTQELMRILDGFSSLLRRGSKKQHDSRNLFKKVKQFNALRFRYHCVNLSCPPLEDINLNFKSTYSLGLVLGALSNLIDNALYWLRIRWPENNQLSERRLYMGTSDKFSNRPAIVIADNGTGFQEDSPANLVRPFFTRKPDGMGLGLYYAHLAMELNSGYLAFPRPGEVEIPDGYDGAVVALVFKTIKRC